MFFTKDKKAQMNQAKEYGLDNCYDITTGVYFIGIKALEDKTIQERISNLLLNGNCFDNNGEVTFDKTLALEMFECTQDGEEIGCNGDCKMCTNRKMISIRPVDMWV